MRILNYDLTNPYEEDYKLLLNYLKVIDGKFNLFFITILILSEPYINHIALGIYNDSFFAKLDPTITLKEKIVGSIFLAEQFDDKFRKQNYVSKKEFLETYFKISFDKLCRIIY